MAGDKSEKKDKKRRESKVDPPTEDVEMADAEETTKVASLLSCTETFTDHGL